MVRMMSDEIKQWIRTSLNPQLRAAYDAETMPEISSFSQNLKAANAGYSFPILDSTFGPKKYTSLRLGFAAVKQSDLEQGLETYMRRGGLSIREIETLLKGLIRKQNADQKLNYRSAIAEAQLGFPTLTEPEFSALKGAINDFGIDNKYHPIIKTMPTDAIKGIPFSEFQAMVHEVIEEEMERFHNKSPNSVLEAQPSNDPGGVLAKKAAAELELQEIEQKFRKAHMLQEAANKAQELANAALADANRAFEAYKTRNQSTKSV